MRCPRCGSEEDGRYCRRCGADLSDPFIQWDYGSPSSSPYSAEKSQHNYLLMAGIVIIVLTIIISLLFGIYHFKYSIPTGEGLNNKEYVDSLSGEGTDIARDPDKEYIADIGKVLEDPDSFTGKYVILSGQISVIDKAEASEIYQVYIDPETDFHSVIVEVPKDILFDSIEEDDFVNIEAKIEGPYTGKTVAGIETTWAYLIADEIKETTYIGALSKPSTTWKFQDNIVEQNGITISVDKVEFAEDETRIFITATNNFSKKYSLWNYSANLFQDGREIERNYENFLAPYPEPASRIPPRGSVSGILCFQNTKPTQLTFSIEGISDDPDVDFTPFVFELSQPE